MALNCHFCEWEDRTATIPPAGLTSKDQRGENTSTWGVPWGNDVRWEQSSHSKEPLPVELSLQEELPCDFDLMLTVAVSLPIISPPQGPVRINNSVPDMQTYPCQHLTFAPFCPSSLLHAFTPPSVAQASASLDLGIVQIVEGLS